MRRKSERTKKAKASPEKVDKPKRGRTSRRKKASSSSEAESGEDASPQAPEVVAVVVPTPEPAPVVGDPQSGDDKVWQVKAAESSSGTGEIKKLKICLSTRPSSTPEPERSPHGRKKLNRTVSSSDTTSEGADEKRRSRHRSRRSARESKDETDRIHEARSEEDDHKMGKKSLSENDESKDVKEMEEASSTDVHPESTTSESAPPVEPESVIVVASPTKDESGTNLKNAEEVTTQADTTGENNHEEKEDEQRPKGHGKTTRASRSSSERERSPEQSEYEKPKLAKIVEQPEESQPEPAKSPEVVEKVHDKKSEEVVDISNNSEQNECENLESANSQSLDKEKKSEDPSTVVGTLENKPDKSQSEESSVIERSSEKPSIEIVNKDDSPKSSSPRERELRTPQSEPEEVFEVQREKSSVHVRSDAEKENNHNSISSDVTNHSKGDGIIEDVAKNIEESYPATPIVVSRKRRWGSRASKANQPRPVSISTDILKDIIPDVKPAELEEVIHEKRHRKKSENVEKHRVERPILPKIVIDNTENANLHRREKDKEHKERVCETPMMEHRKISLVKEDNFVGRPPSPPRHKSSSILFITNLVRPFTLAQLKNLLQRTGKIVPDGFWIDRIKSKCFVTYENEDQAVETRHALHGVTWPVSNPKTLQVDFSSQDALDRTRAAEAENKDPPSAIPGTVEDWLREQDAKKDRFGETDESKPWDRRNIVREWDVGKGEKEKERNKRDERPQEKRRHKTPERSPEPARKFKKKEEEAPAKMLDDLFRKTKTVPCIYWLPLSAETIAVKEEQRRQHMAEHERRMQELERSRTHRRH